MNDHVAVVILADLVRHLEEEIRYLEQSRLLHLTPAERSKRIRDRKAWIGEVCRVVPELKDIAERR